MNDQDKKRLKERARLAEALSPMLKQVYELIDKSVASATCSGMSEEQMLEWVKEAWIDYKVMGM